jgi:hypothetical protein
MHWGFAHSGNATRKSCYLLGASVGGDEKRVNCRGQRYYALLNKATPAQTEGQRNATEMGTVTPPRRDYRDLLPLDPALLYESILWRKNRKF